MRKNREMAICAAVLVGLALTIILSGPYEPANASSRTINFRVTLYGWPDNSPPGNAIAYPTGQGLPSIHSSAGGTGTYTDPITFATDQAELPAGTKIYVPHLHRYFIMEDDCTECDQDWSSHGPDGGPGLYHVDLWVGGEGAQNSQDVINCEDDLTQNSGQVIVDPPATEPVYTTPLFNSSNDACYNPGS